VKLLRRRLSRPNTLPADGASSSDTSALAATQELFGHWASILMGHSD
jgi:hypothetical protein